MEQPVRNYTLEEALKYKVELTDEQREELIAALLQRDAAQEALHDALGIDLETFCSTLSTDLPECIRIEEFEAQQEITKKLFEAYLSTKRSIEEEEWIAGPSLLDKVKEILEEFNPQLLESAKDET